MNMEIKTTYSVQYQQKQDDGTENEGIWWEFTGKVFTNPVGCTHHETADFNEAFGVAKDLYDGKIVTSDIPRYRAHVTATQVVQRIYAGGTVITFGEPRTEPEESDKDAS